MEKEKNVVVSSGFSVSKLLGVAFVVLKLLGEITWSWVWVLSPFWIPIALVVGFVVIALLIQGVLILLGAEY